jgi:KaiC/GvpD/RAD55 family RecA-like ATPase|tara:strand:- start:365 stop:592 length:228 start_codon:yes stop_codon:yes gene_type:complete
MKLNKKQNDASHIVRLNEQKTFNTNLVEERPSAFADTNDSDIEATEVADMLIRQNQIINRALRRTYRSRIARKAI